MKTQELVGLSVLLPELRALTDQQLPSYRKIWSMAVDGRLAAQQVNGRWFVSRDDLPTVLAALGLTAKLSKPATSRKAQPASIAA